ncbi:hypothetical protein THAOC_06135, partial [Thalassiosira oceanica]
RVAEHFDALPAPSWWIVPAAHSARGMPRTPCEETAAGDGFQCVSSRRSDVTDPAGAQGWTRAPVEDIAAAAMPSTAHGLNHNSIDTIDTLRTVPNDCLHPSTPIFHACRGQTEINANCLSGSRRRAAPNRRIWTGPSAGTSPMTPSRTDNTRRPPGKVSDVAIDPSPPTS